MKRTHAEAASTLQEAHINLTQTSLKDHFRVTKTRQQGKENICDSDAIFSPSAKLLRSPLMPLSRGPNSGQWMASIHTPSSAKAASKVRGGGTCAAVVISPPVMSEGGISLSTAPFEFPAPSEDTSGPADITSRLPSYGTAAAGLFSYRMPCPAHPAQHLPISAADPDEVSCRQRPLPSQPICLPGCATPVATFSNGAPATADPEFSTASLASWLPGKGCSSFQAAGCADDESDCEDDAVSHRHGFLAAAPAASTPGHVLPQAASVMAASTPAVNRARSTSCSLAHELLPPPTCQGGATAAVHSPDAACGAVGCPMTASDDCDDEVGSAAAGLEFLLQNLAQGGAADVQPTAGAKNQGKVTGRLMYQTRLEELLFGMIYVPAPTANEPDGAEE